MLELYCLFLMGFMKNKLDFQRVVKKKQQFYERIKCACTIYKCYTQKGNHTLHLKKVFLILITIISISNHSYGNEKLMEAKGTFEVKLDPQSDLEAPAGRMIINKSYSGDFVGTGKGQMLSKRTPSGSAVYSAIEEVEGTTSDLSGSFTLIHLGSMSSEGQSLEVKIVNGSGTGDFENISGTLDIIQADGNHSYVLNYSL